VKEISFINSLDCTASCGWCVHQCSDEDKYEILVFSLQIQKECLLICKTINLMLGGTAPESVHNVIELFKKLAIHVQDKSGASKTKELIPGSVERKKPGCSQIFLIAQMLEQSCLNQSYRND
jgi:hypothetical protein